MTATPDQRPVRNLTLREQVVEHLREEILSNRLEPGSELNEVALANLLGVSRGPIREALGGLAAEGLVTINPRRGAIVTKLTKQEFMDAYQVREALETLATRVAVPRLTDEEKADLHRMSDDMRRLADADDANAFFEINRRFHEKLVAASGNRRLFDMHQQLLGQMGRLLRKSAELRGGLGESAAAHERILEAVDAGDAERAARLMAEHIEVPQRVLDSPEAQDLFDEADASEIEKAS
ncbi:MAG TPA: GntR family transcriptional regulator [Thermoleophilaceae bacterium]